MNIFMSFQIQPQPSLSVMIFPLRTETKLSTVFNFKNMTFIFRFCFCHQFWRKILLLKFIFEECNLAIVAFKSFKAITQLAESCFGNHFRLSHAILYTNWWRGSHISIKKINLLKIECLNNMYIEFLSPSEFMA